MEDPTRAQRRRAVLGTAAFAAAPATALGVVPWLLTRWQVRHPVPGGVPAQALGGVLAAAGAAVVAHSFVRFAVEGVGTPAPVAPTRNLVVSGMYAYVRNPIYLALAAALAGEGLLLGQPKLLACGGLVLLPAAVFVRLYEEPKLARTFGSGYEEYLRNVPGWIPRLRPWHREAGGHR
jgi:protein-S-isoprenylcysteine O-methyltransferase Ste14